MKKYFGQYHVVMLVNQGKSLVRNENLVLFKKKKTLK